MQIGYAVVHFLVSIALNFLAVFLITLAGLPVFYYYIIAALIGILGIHREATYDWGQHEASFPERLRYSINPMNFSFSELRDDWTQAVAWPLGSVALIWMMHT